MTTRLAVLALMILPLAACDGANLGLGKDPEAAAPTGPRPPAVSPLDQPIETGSVASKAVSTAERTTYETAAFSARGNEPFWAVDVAGNTAIYKTPQNQRGTPIRVSRLTFSKGVEFIGVHAGRPFVVNIRGGNCRDTMSGDRFPMTASLTVSGKTTTGCAGPATAEVAQAVSSTRAPAPAEPRARTRAAAPKPAAPAAKPAATQAKPADSTETPATTTPAPEATTPAPAATFPAPVATETPAPSTTTPASPSPAGSTPSGTAPAPSVVPAPTLVLPSTPPVAGAPTSEPAKTED